MFFIRCNQIISDTGGNKRLSDTLDFPDFSKQIYISAMVDMHNLAEPIGIYTSDVVACTFFKLLFTLISVHIGSRSADIGDDSLVILVFVEISCLLENILLRSCSYGSALMNADCAE